MTALRILIVDDHAILRDGLRSLLERQSDMEVIGEAASGEEALQQTAALEPDIVVMDVAMPGMNGLEATQIIKQRHPEVKVLILTQHDNREYILPLLQAGASGYVLKRSGGRDVVQAIRQVYEQGAFLEPSIARQLLSGYVQSEEPPESNIPHLTDREREVLRLVVSGKSNKEIASLLYISPKTVSVHRSNIMTKLDVRNSIELIRYAQRHNLVDLDTGEIDI
jgi:DNA-binding NarL/FixJ family response regulator